ncbi:MAG: peptidylprolyl isomerase [bacterium]
MRVISFLVAIGFLMVFAFCSCSKEQGDMGRGKEKQGGEMFGAEASGSGIAVMVNGKALTEADIMQEEERLMRQFGAQIDTSQIDEMKQVLRDQAIRNMIDRELLRQAADKEKIKVEKSDIQERIDEIAQRVGSKEALLERLEVMGMSEDALRLELENGMRIEKLIEKHSQVKKVSDEEARTFYDQNKERFVQPERIRASHILIQVDANASPTEKQAERKEAERILSELKKGADFAQLASQYSDCPSKQKGGDLGYFSRGQMVEPFEEAAYALGVGEISGIVETQYGYHIIKLTDRQETRVIPFEEVKPNLIDYIQEEKKQEAIGKYLEGLRSSAKIEYPKQEGK